MYVPADQAGPPAASMPIRASAADAERNMTRARVARFIMIAPPSRTGGGRAAGTGTVVVDGDQAAAGGDRARAGARGDAATRERARAEGPHDDRAGDRRAALIAAGIEGDRPA